MIFIRLFCIDRCSLRKKLILGVLTSVEQKEKLLIRLDVVKWGKVIGRVLNSQIAVAVPLISYKRKIIRHVVLF